MENKQKKFSLSYGGNELIIETGKLAQQALASATVRYGDTVILATVAKNKEPREGIDFFPLMVEYEERLYAAGKIKGSRFIKREGRPTDEAILTARMIDRSIRPLFNEEQREDIQVVLTVLSVDQENSPDIVALLAASAVLSISGLEWKGPLAGARIGMINGQFILNPTCKEIEESSLDLILAGNSEKIIMVEAGAKEVKEESIIEAIKFAQEAFDPVIDLFKKLKAEFVIINEEKNLKIKENEDEKQKIKDYTKGWLKKNIGLYLFDNFKKTKEEREKAMEKAKNDLSQALEKENFDKELEKEALSLAYEAAKNEVSKMIIEKDCRIDGRKLNETRPINIEVGLLPRTHGSTLFSRGETQVLSVVTLGAPGDEQTLDTMETEGTKRYMHHYNFPPFCTGEVSPMRSTSRREIGHGALAERAITPVLPSKEEFPYTIRVVSEVLGSNGSSSMASTCGSSLSLMDAGIPIKKQVAGVAMGLASDDQGRWKIITDLQAIEDGDGGMDFKITGTKDGITAIQMDTKTDGLTIEMIEQTFKQGLLGRLEILEKMNAIIPDPRKELSPYAPRITSFMIDPEKIREVIGPGGKVINEIIDNTGVTIDIEDSGLVMVCSTNAEASKKAVEWIKNIVKEVEAGEEYQGKVTRIMEFGAFVEILPKQEGLVHVSELAPFRVNHPSDIVKVGDIISVKVIEIDSMGRINLSHKQTAEGQSRKMPANYPSPHSVSGKPRFNDRPHGRFSGNRNRN